MKQVTIYSDGGSINNGYKDPDKPMYGAYCTVLVNNKQEVQKIICDIYEDATNNQMELFGAIQGIKYIKNLMTKFPNEKIKITLCSDSQYLIKGCSEWMFGWKKRGWRNSSGEIIPNLNLWTIIDEYLNDRQFEFDFKWVKGHKGKSISLEENPDVYFNEMCDTELSNLLNKKRKLING